MCDNTVTDQGKADFLFFDRETLVSHNRTFCAPCAPLVYPLALVGSVSLMGRTAFKGIEMDGRLIWRGYRTHSLDEAEQRFYLQHRREPNFFAVQQNWEVEGSDENQKKVVKTSLAGFAGIFIPMTLTLEEFQAIESERAEVRALAPAHIPEDDIDDPFHSATRYCPFCGCIFSGPADEKIPHCGSAICQTRYEDFMRGKREISELITQNPKWHNFPQEGKGAEKKDSTPDFELDEPNRTDPRGYIYFIEAENGLVKIGRSDNISKRFSSLTTMSPVRLYLRHAVASSNYMRAEGWLHEQFAPKRDHGEWFGLSPDDLEWIKSLKDFCLDLV